MGKEWKLSKIWEWKVQSLSALTWNRAILAMHQKMKEEIKQEESKTCSCTNCGHVFAERYNLKRHEEKRSCHEKFKCDKCRLKFLSRAELKNHTEETNCLQCKTCNAVSASYGALITHRMRHKKLKKHKCTECEKSFHSNSALQSLLSSH